MFKSKKSILKTGLFLSLFFTSIGYSAQSESNTSDSISYGEVFVTQLKSTSEKKWQFEAAYTYGFSNPYIGIHGLELSFNRRMGEFVQIGFSPTVFATTDKSLTDGLASELGAQGIESKVYRPIFSGYATLALSPLSGMLNWMNTSSVEFDLKTGFGIGASKYKYENSLLPSAKIFIIPELMLTKTIGLNAGLQITFDRFSDGDWQNRFDTLIGVVGRF